MPIQERLQKDMVEAMRGKEELRLSVLRMMKTAIHNRQVEKRRPLEDSEVEQVLATLIKQRHDSAQQFRAGGRQDLAAKEEQEVVFIEAYLSAAVGEEEIDAAIEAALDETGANSPKQMGAVMKATMAKLAGRRVDGKMVSNKVKQRLGG